MSVDLICPSFAPLPASMWVAASAMIDVIIEKCWLLLAAFVTIKILTDALQDYEQVSLATHLRTLFRALVMVVVLSYYKQLLMYFDYFIDSLCMHGDEGLARAAQRLSDTGQVKKEVDVTKLSSIWQALKSIFSVLEKVIALLSHQGAIYLMHYLRAVALLVLMQLGPLAMLLSWLPGPFQGSFQQWLKSYITISCWAITLQIFWALSKAFAGVAWLGDVGLVEEIEPVAHTLLSIILLIAIFMTPTWTAKFMGSAMLSNFVTSVGGLASQGGKIGVHYTKKLLGAQ